MRISTDDRGSIIILWRPSLCVSGASRQLIEHARVRKMLSGPSNDSREQVTKISTLLREFISVTNRAHLIGRPRDDPRFLEPLQSISENVCGDPLRRLEQLTVGVSTSKKVAGDQQRPFIADQIQHIGDGARRAREPYASAVLFFRTPGWLFSSVFLHLHIASQYANKVVTCKMKVTLNMERLALCRTLSHLIHIV